MIDFIQFSTFTRHWHKQLNDHFEQAGQKVHFRKKKRESPKLYWCVCATVSKGQQVRTNDITLWTSSALRGQ